MIPESLPLLFPVIQQFFEVYLIMFLGLSFVQIDLASPRLLGHKEAAARDVNKLKKTERRFRIGLDGEHAPGRFLFLLNGSTDILSVPPDVLGLLMKERADPRLDVSPVPVKAD